MSLSTTPRSAPGGARRPGRCLALLALVLLGAAPYAHVIGFEFSYDDHWTVVGNRHLDAPVGWLLERLADGRALRVEVPDATRPAMVLSLRIDRALFDRDPRGHHAHSLLLHLGCSLLLAALAFALSRERVQAWLAAALFAVAPLHAEVVASVHYREDLLSGIGVALALTLLLWPAPRRQGWGRAVGAAAALFVALCAKENALVFLPLALLLPAALGLGEGALQRRERTLFATGAATLLWLNWRWAMFLLGDDLPRAPALDALGTLRETLGYWGWAVRSALAPLWVSPLHVGNGGSLDLALGIALPPLCLALCRRPGTRLLGVGLLLAMALPLGSSPLLGPFNVRADRYLYLSLFGGCLIWAQLLGFVLAQVRGSRRVLAMVSIALLLLGLALRTHGQAAAFRDDLSLWQAATRAAPRSARAFTGLSSMLRRQGRLDEAHRAIERALQLDPSYTQARVTRVYNLLAGGEVEDARLEIARISAAGPRPESLDRALRCIERPPHRVPACIQAR